MTILEKAQKYGREAVLKKYKRLIFRNMDYIIVRFIIKYIQ